MARKKPKLEKSEQGSHIEYQKQHRDEMISRTAMPVKMRDLSRGYSPK